MLDGGHRPIAEVAPNLPQHKIRAIEQALAMDPEQRPGVHHLLRQWSGVGEPRGAAPLTDSLLGRAFGRGEGDSLEVASVLPSTPTDETFEDPAIPVELARAPSRPASRTPWGLLVVVGVGLGGIALLVTSVATGSLAYLVGRGAGATVVVEAPEPEPIDVPEPAPAPAPEPRPLVRPARVTIVGNARWALWMGSDGRPVASVFG